MLADIVTQLEEYCPCVDSPDTEDIQEIVSIISMYTCWTNTPCETFLLGERREVVDLPPCLDCAFEFEPFYTPFDTESFDFVIVKQEGSTITEEHVDAVYNRATGKFIVDTGLPSCNCYRKCSPCKADIKLVVTYEAGYERLPECLLPVFCNLLEVIKAKNECDCEKDCGCNSENQQNIKYAEGDIVTVQVETELGKIILHQYMKQISLISLCVERHIWGDVV